MSRVSVSEGMREEIWAPKIFHPSLVRARSTPRFFASGQVAPMEKLHPWECSTLFFGCRHSLTNRKIKNKKEKKGEEENNKKTSEWKTKNKIAAPANAFSPSPSGELRYFSHEREPISRWNNLFKFQELDCPSIFSSFQQFFFHFCLFSRQFNMLPNGYVQK